MHEPAATEEKKKSESRRAKVSRAVATRPAGTHCYVPGQRGRERDPVRACVPVGRRLGSMACMLHVPAGLAAGAGSVVFSSCQPPLASTHDRSAGRLARARAPCRAPAEPAAFLGLSLGASGSACRCTYICFGGSSRQEAAAIRIELARRAQSTCCLVQLAGSVCRPVCQSRRWRWVLCRCSVLR